MRGEDFYQLMNEQEQPTKETVELLREMLDKYPWFHTARTLYLKALFVTGDMRFGMELKRMSVFIPDRRKLFIHIEGQELSKYLDADDKVNTKVEDTFLLIDSFLSSHADEKKFDPETSIAIQPSVSNDYLYWSTYSIETPEQEDTKEKEQEVKLKHHELIDSFIREDETRTPGIRIPLEKEEEKEPTKEITIPEESKQEEKPVDDSFFTETLARIYIKQKRYDKALQIIKNLSLKYPEKNVYFADQIRFLEKLIINTKK